MPQSDVHLFVLPDHGGQARLSEDDYIEGAPELIVEVTASSVGYALHNKKDLYERDGVREYIVWRVEEQAIDWFLRRRGKFKPLAPGPDGVVRSETFPGLWLDVAAMIRGDYRAWFTVLQNGIASPEHDTFIDRLERRPAQKRG